MQVKGRVAVLEARLGVAPSQDAVEEDFDLFGEEVMLAVPQSGATSVFLQDEGQEKQAIPELKPAKTKSGGKDAALLALLPVAIHHRASSGGQVNDCPGSEAVGYGDRYIGSGLADSNSSIANALNADMKEVEQLVRSIACEGLLWGACECL